MRLEKGVLPILVQALRIGAASPELLRQLQAHQSVIKASGLRDGDPESAAQVIELLYQWTSSQDAESP
jgi:hypothetical protein